MKSTFYSYSFDGADGELRMQDVMKMFRFGFKSLGGLKVEEILDHRKGSGERLCCGPEGIESSGEWSAVEYRLAGGSAVIIRPFGAELNYGTASDTDDAPRIEISILIAGGDNEIAGGVNENEGAGVDEEAADIERRVRRDLESILFMDHGMGYCCE